MSIVTPELIAHGPHKTTGSTIACALSLVWLHSNLDYNVLAVGLKQVKPLNLYEKAFACWEGHPRNRCKETVNLSYCFISRPTKRIRSIILSHKRVISHHGVVRVISRHGVVRVIKELSRVVVRDVVRVVRKLSKSVVRELSESSVIRESLECHQESSTSHQSHQRVAGKVIQGINEKRLIVLFYFKAH